VVDSRPYQEVVRDADIVCSNVFNDDQVLSVLYDCSVLERLRSDSIQPTPLASEIKNAAAQ
jgi:3-hydroxyisobutyrate dehydrogenase-like beta-hydroxyacid dehydrogenase